MREKMLIGCFKCYFIAKHQQSHKNCSLFSSHVAAEKFFRCYDLFEYVEFVNAFAMEVKEIKLRENQ